MIKYIILFVFLFAQSCTNQLNPLEVEFYKPHLKNIEVYEAFNSSYGSKKVNDVFANSKREEILEMCEKNIDKSNLINLYNKRYPPHLHGHLNVIDLNKDITNMLYFVAYDTKKLDSKKRIKYINTILNYLNIYHCIMNEPSKSEYQRQAAAWCLEGLMANKNVLKKIGIIKNQKNSGMPYIIVTEH